jgi:hypothetical protein
MSQIPPTAASQNQPAQPAPPPPPPPPAPAPATSGTASLSAEAQQKIAAIYANAATEHTPPAQVQQEIDVVIAESPSAAPPANRDQINLFDATA